MAAVDATEVIEAAMAVGHGYPTLAAVGTDDDGWYQRLADSALAALFARAGIDGPGTIALTRDAEGRYGLEKQDGYPPLGGGVWNGRRGAWLVPVEDDEEGADLYRLRGIEEGGPCEICDGSGVWARYQGEGEMDELPCDACDGTGRGRG